jgi:hypothetical protein
MADYDFRSNWGTAVPQNYHIHDRNVSLNYGYGERLDARATPIGRPGHRQGQPGAEQEPSGAAPRKRIAVAVSDYCHFAPHESFSNLGTLFTISSWQGLIWLC